MGTGIVSNALSLDGQETISRVLLGLTVVIWVALATMLPVRLVRDHARFRTEAGTPAALTSVAGTAVLGTRFALLGWTWAAGPLFAIALILWCSFMVPVLANWRTPTVGSSLVLTVSTESLAVFAAALSVREHSQWLLFAALAPFALGLVFYVFVISRFDLRQLGLGHGDHWVAGGALAISALAAGRITLAAKALGVLGSGGGGPRDLAAGLWVLTMLWLPVLLLAEVLRPRLRYELRRWLTVFPFGMYAACSFVVGTAIHAGAATSFARVWVWVALAVWTAVFVAMISRGFPEVGGAVDHSESRGSE